MTENVVHTHSSTSYVTTMWYVYVCLHSLTTMFRIFEGFDELPFNFDDEEPVSSNYATEPAVDNSRKRTYNNRTRVRRPKASQFGKKNTRDDDYY